MHEDRFRDLQPKNDKFKPLSPINNKRANKLIIALSNKEIKLK